MHQYTQKKRDASRQDASLTKYHKPKHNLNLELNPPIIIKS